MRHVLLSVVLLVVWASSAAGQEAANTSERRSIAFVGVMHGVTETLLMLNESGVLPDLKICPPEEATPRQFIRVVVEYLHEHPEELREPDGVLIMKAMSDAFPCQHAESAAALE